MNRKFTINETAKLFEVSRSKVYGWVRSGKLKAEHEQDYHRWEIKEESIRYFASCHTEYRETIARNLGPVVSPELMHAIDETFRPIVKAVIKRIKAKKNDSKTLEGGV